MTSKERVLTAFAHQRPDRVPIDYSSNPGIDKRLKQHYGLAEDDGEGLRRALGVDFRSAGAPYIGPKLHADVPGRSDTLQPEAKNMAPAYLKGRWGERLSFHGCISTAGPVAYGTVDDVVRNVRAHQREKCYPHLNQAGFRRHPGIPARRLPGTDRTSPFGNRTGSICWGCCHGCCRFSKRRISSAACGSWTRQGYAFTEPMLKNEASLASRDAFPSSLFVSFLLLPHITFYKSDGPPPAGPPSIFF